MSADEQTQYISDKNNETVARLVKARTAKKGEQIPANLLSAEGVDEKNVIKALVQHVFVCPNGTISEKSSRIYLRSGYEQIIDEERSKLFESGTHLALFPALFWKDELTTYDMWMNFQLALQSDSCYSDWYQWKEKELVYVEYQIVDTVGCKHYVRGCSLICDKCPTDDTYMCKRCHTERAVTNIDDEDHDIAVTKVKCLYCGEVQPFGKLNCVKCNAIFGNEICEKCALIKFTSDFKPSFHCDKCDKCYYGSSDIMKHCDKCNTCVFASCFGHHDKHCQGVRNSAANCMICSESLDESNMQFGSLPCGKDHLIHKACFQKALMNKQFKCPICSNCIVTKEYILRKKIKFY